MSSLLVLSGIGAKPALAGPTTPQPEPVPRATPVLAVDDTRTEGPSAPNWFDVELEARQIAGATDDGLQAVVAQLSVGSPTSNNRDLRALLDPYQLYQLRVRSLAFRHADGWQYGPLTVGVQRYFPVEHVSFLPLAYAHFGVEAVASTPWLSGRFVSPPKAVRIVDGVDTELAQNGWSLRPLSAYVRADFLACQSVFGELGVAPELFVPSSGNTEYDLRFHVALGRSFGCAGRATNHRPKVSLEYKGRIHLPVAGVATEYKNALGIGVQYELHGVALQVLASAAPHDHMRDYWMLGLRVRFGSAKDSS